MGGFQLLWVAAACALASLALARDLPAAPPTMESGGPLAADRPSTFAIGVVVGRGIGIAPAAVFGHMIRRHRDRSAAGADVILGGLVTAMLAAVACYIRVTRRKAGEEE